MRTILKCLGGLALIALFVALYGLLEARRDPVVRRATLAFADWPQGAKPVRAVLISDVHFGNLTMGPARLARIVGQINALHPDIVLIAGDFIAGHAPGNAARAMPGLTAALSRLHAPLGVVAVRGNHDRGADVDLVRRALERAGVTVLINGAVRRGPLVIGGIDDRTHSPVDIGRTLWAMAALGGPGIVMAHDPDVARAMNVSGMEALLPATGPRTIVAGHTHCGQIAVPGLGPVLTLIDRREKFLCGRSYRDRDRVVVTAGLGTSILPIRIAAPPDLWLLTLGPAAATRR